MANRSTFWSAYSAAVENYLTNQTTLPKDNEIFALPFTVPFTNATLPLKDEDLNYLVYNLADTTLSADGSKRYAQELNTYVSSFYYIKLALITFAMPAI